MKTNLKDWISAEPGRERLFAQEQLIVAVAEHIWEKMEESEATKSDIAKALGKSKAFITQLLNGTRNMTLRSLSDIAFALDAQVKIELRERHAVDDWCSAKPLETVGDVVSEQRLSHNAAGAADARLEGMVTVKHRYPEAKAA